MSVVATTVNVPNDVVQTYQHMLPDNPDGIAFLFGPNFSEALQVPADRVALAYQVTKEAAIEELRRLLAIKVFTVDEDATKTSPTPLSTQNYPNHLSYFMLTCETSARALACSYPGYAALRSSTKRSGTCSSPPSIRSKRAGL